MHLGMLVGKWTQSVVIIAWCQYSETEATQWPRAPSKSTGPLVTKKWPAWFPTQSQMLLPKSCSPCSPQMQHLFLGNCKWLLHLNFATIIDYNIFKRFITAIGLRALDLPYNILGGDERAKKRNSEWFSMSKTPSKSQELLYSSNLVV